MMEAETTPQQPTTTTMIRSSDPDLTIIVGKGEQQKIYECHSPIMAMYSQYIDSMLATPMREQKTRTISFSEIDSADWESMIGYLQAGVPPQTLDQVCAVLPFYDKYEFQSGLAICDRMLAAFDFDVDANLDQCMVAVEMVYKYAQRFPIAKAKATACVRTVFASHARMFCLEKEHICRLVPALREDESLWTLAVKKGLNSLGDNLDSEVYLADPLFPEVLDVSIQALAIEHALRKTHASIEVTGAGAVEANGTYVYEKQRASFFQNGTYVQGNNYVSAVYEKRAPSRYDASHFIRHCAIRNTGLPVWAIFRTQGSPHGEETPYRAFRRDFLYVCPLSRNVVVPPTHGWQPYAQTIPSPAPIFRFVQKRGSASCTLSEALRPRRNHPIPSPNSSIRPEACATTLDRVRAVLPFCDEYEFQSSLAICDRMLAAFNFDVDANLDQCMVAVEMVYKYAQRFPVAKTKATACVRTVFASHARMFCLEKEHICRLVPALREDESLWTLAVKKALNPFDTNLNSEMYLASAFLPEVLERSIKALANGDALRQTRASIEVTGAGAVEANGTHVYEKQRGGSYWYAKRTASPSQEASHFIRRRAMRNTGLPGWIIFRARGPPRGDGIPVPTDDRSILYVRRMSRNVGVPPTHGWKPFVQTIPSPAPILRFG
jgi:hypothetical protein